MYINKGFFLTVLLLPLLAPVFSPPGVYALNDNRDAPIEVQPETLPTAEYEGVSDPFEGFNRISFEFNDRFYFWILKPVAQGYSYIFPQDIRVVIRNFFRNLSTPIRMVNALLQGKFSGAATEVARFGINTTAGVLGLDDVAGREFHLESTNEDLGQTLGYYGVDNGFYVVWPFLGPSSLRDTVGFVGDIFLEPLDYIFKIETTASIRAYVLVNDVSLHLGEYEDLKESSIDPYVAVQDAYIQHRRDQIRK